MSERAQISAVNFYGTVFLSPLYHGIANSRVQIHASTSKEEEEMVGTWLGEICSCSCLTLLPGSALVPLNLIDTFISRRKKVWGSERVMSHSLLNSVLSSF